MATPEPSVSFGGSEDKTTARTRTYRITFISDLGSDGRLSGLTPVDKDEFPRVLAAARPALALRVEKPAGGVAEWEFRLAIESMGMFDPRGFLPHVAGARWRLGVRDKFGARLRGEISAAELSAAVEAAAAGDTSLRWLTQATGAPGAAGSQAGAGGNILDMVDEPDDAARVSAGVEQIARSAGESERRVSSAESAALRTHLDRLERDLVATSDAVLKNPEFRATELAWRSVKYLVDNLDFREGVRLHLLDASRDHLVDRLLSELINPAFDGEIETPNLIVIDLPFTNNPEHIATLDLIAQHAAGLPAPVVVPIESGFFDLKSLRLIKNVPNLSNLVDGWAFAKWRSFREQPYARAIAPVMGRFILRAPFEFDSPPAPFRYRETVQAISDLVWANGHLALAVCAARSFVNNGWPTRMFGASAGAIGNLPIVQNPNDPAQPWGPGDLVLPDRRMDEPASIGMNSLNSVPGKDECFLLGGVTAGRPMAAADVSPQQATLEVSLPYQQFSNITSAWLCDQLPRLRGMPAERVQAELLYGLGALLGLEKEEDQESVIVGVGEDATQPGRIVVQVRLTPPARIVPGGLSLTMNVTI